MEIPLATELLSVAPDTYCPTYRRWRKVAKHVARKTGRKRELVVDSMTPGYLFVLIEDSYQLASVYAHKDVFGFVSTSVGVCFARSADIDALRELERERASNSSGQASAKKSKIQAKIKEMVENLSMIDIKGKMVKMKDGPLVGRVGFVVDADKKSGLVKIEIEGVDVKTKVESVEVV